MKATSFFATPPKTYRLEFSRAEGWAVVAALRRYSAVHPQAEHAGEWRKWAEDLDRELRR